MFPPNLVEACFKQVKMFCYFQLRHNKLRNWNVTAFSLGISCTCTYSRNKSDVCCQLPKIHKPNQTKPIKSVLCFPSHCLSICYKKRRKHLAQQNKNQVLSKCQIHKSTASKVKTEFTLQKQCYVNLGDTEICTICTKTVRYFKNIMWEMCIGSKEEQLFCGFQ